VLEPAPDPSPSPTPTPCGWLRAPLAPETQACAPPVAGATRAAGRTRGAVDGAAGCRGGWPSATSAAGCSRPRFLTARLERWRTGRSSSPRSGSAAGHGEAACERQAARRERGSRLSPFPRRRLRQGSNARSHRGLRTVHPLPWRWPPTRRTAVAFSRVPTRFRSNQQLRDTSAGVNSADTQARECS
jgi:hypothetical protein